MRIEDVDKEEYKAFYGFVCSKPPDEEYNYLDCSHCAVAQFLMKKHNAYEINMNPVSFIMGKNGLRQRLYDTEIFLVNISGNRPNVKITRWTFGHLRKELEQWPQLLK